MIVEPKGLWEHSAYQTDNRFILEVKPIVEDPNKLVQGTRQGYKGDKLSLNFQNVEVRAVLQVIADFTGLNIITSDSVSGSLTLRLKDIPWDQALDIIMQTKGLDMRKNGNVVLIAPREELALKEKQQLEAQKDISELEPLVAESFQLNYIKAQDLLRPDHDEPAAAVRRGGGPDRDDGRSGLVHFEARGRDGRPAVEHPVRAGHPVQPRGDPQDHPADRHGDPAGGDRGAHRDRQRQVRPAARRALRRPDGIPDQQQVRGRPGRQPQHAARRDASGTTATRETRTQTPYELASGITYAGYSDSPQLNVNLPVLNAAGSLALTLINLGSGNLINLELSALESDNRGKVVSSPRVVTGDNQKARHRAGHGNSLRDAGQREQSGHGAASRRRC